MVADAERYAEQFATGALERDRDGTFATEHLAALRDGRFLVAPIPIEFGGGGVTSAHDVLVAVSRLAPTPGSSPRSPGAPGTLRLTRTPRCGCRRTWSTWRRCVPCSAVRRR
jgi:alkylation response protein AidB-like acyl-CoA dehydrogenase